MSALIDTSITCTSAAYEREAAFSRQQWHCCSLSLCLGCCPMTVPQVVSKHTHLPQLMGITPVLGAETGFVACSPGKKTSRDPRSNPSSPCHVDIEFCTQGSDVLWAGLPPLSLLFTRLSGLAGSTRPGPASSYLHIGQRIFLEHISRS